MDGSWKMIGLGALAAIAIAAPGDLTPHTVPQSSSDSAAVVSVVDAYHTALETADTAAVRSLLAEDAIIQEGGGIETREEYFSHHMAADMRFAAAMEADRRVEQVRVRGGVAWVASTSSRSGTFRDRELDLEGAELMVLTRTGNGWRIAAIHWSSRSR